MTKPGDSQTKKTLHELAKEFPEKTYRELEKYRDADRQEEALGIGAIGPRRVAFDTGAGDAQRARRHDRAAILGRNVANAGEAVDQCVEVDVGTAAEAGEGDHNGGQKGFSGFGQTVCGQ